MEQKKYCCRNCGSSKIREVGDVIECISCGVKFKAVEENKKIVEEMRTLADEIKAERVAALRRQLYELANAEYIDSGAMLEICREIRYCLPDDFMAQFYQVANGGTLREYANFINKIKVDEVAPFIPEVIKFTVKSLQSELILPIKNLVERAYKNTDIPMYVEMQTIVECEAEKVEEGVYDITVPRDAFIIYSSKDMEKVMELVEVLENQGLTCFVAMRNLQHGRGAKENYQSALETAIDYCKCVVFVSSRNSRNASCDACRVELPYIRRKDLQNAPREFRRDYATIPNQYKKRRVEYMIQTSEHQTAADRKVKEFFDGIEYCGTPDEVADRILSFDNEIDDEYVSNADLRMQFEKMMADNNAKEKDEAAQLKAQIEELKRRQAEELKQKDEEIKRQQAELIRTLEEAQQRPTQPAPTIDKATLVEMMRQIEEEKSRFKAEEEAKRRAEEDKRRAEEEKRRADEEKRRADEEKRREDEIKAREEKKRADENAKRRAEDELAKLGRVNDTQQRRELESAFLADAKIEGGKLIKYNGKAKHVVIPKSVTEIGSRAFFYCSGIEKVELPFGLKKIGAYAFYRCGGLKEIDIPATVGEIEMSSFWGCSSLIGVNLPDGLMKIGGSAFDGCTKVVAYVASQKQLDALKADASNGLKEYKIGAFNGPRTKISKEALAIIEKEWQAYADQCRREDEKRRAATLAEQEAAKKAEAEAQKKAEDDAKRRAAEAEKRKADAEARRRADEEKRKADLEAKRRAEEEARKKAEAEKLRLEEEKRKAAAAKAAEERRLAAAARAEEKRKADAAKAAEEKRKAEAAKAAEEKRKADAARKLESFKRNSQIVGETLVKYNGNDPVVEIPMGIKIIGPNAFKGSTTLTSVRLPSSIEQIEAYAFHSCRKLTTVNLPEGITQIHKSAFWGCPLVTVTIPSSATKVSSDAFCHACAINVAPTNKTYASIDGNLHSKDGKKIITYAGGNPRTTFRLKFGVTAIDSWCFDGANHIKDLYLPLSLTNIGGYAFHDGNIINYAGSLFDWLGVKKDPDWKYITNVSVRYNSR